MLPKYESVLTLSGTFFVVPRAPRQMCTPPHPARLPGELAVGALPATVVVGRLDPRTSRAAAPVTVVQWLTVLNTQQPRLDGCHYHRCGHPPAPSSRPAPRTYAASLQPSPDANTARFSKARRAHSIGTR